MLFRSVRLLLRLAALGALLGLSALAAGAAVGAPVLALMYGAEYARYVDVMLWLLLGRVALFVYTYVKAAQVVMRRLQRQLAVALASAGAGAVFGFLLIPQHGMVGAAMSVAATQWFALVVGAATLVLGIGRAREREGIPPDLPVSEV